jgi:transcriptional regulator with XRE-family HTH domain
MATDEAQGLLQREVAELLGVSRPRVAQLLRSGNLRRNAAGRIDPAEVERCRRQEPIAWANPPALPPQAPAPAPAQGGDELALRRELQRLQDREQRWQSSYTTFWHWVREAHYEAELWRELGNQPEIGAVMSTARRLLVAQLGDLNQLLLSR